MTTLEIVGLVLLMLAAGRYVKLWVELIFARGSRPRVRTLFVLMIAVAAAAGATLFWWSAIAWWYMPIFYVSAVVLIAIPLVIFRAR